MKKTLAIISGVLVSICFGCSSSPKNDIPTPSAKAQVQVQNVEYGAIVDSVKLSASVFFLTKNQVTAPISGYVQQADVTPGAYAKKGQKLFTLQTKEARILGKSAAADSLGVIELDAPSSGQVISVSHFIGDYVQEGATLAQIIYPDNLYLKLFVPFKYRRYVQNHMSIPVLLPDGTKINSTVEGSLSRADSSSQTAIYLLKPHTNHLLPEGLRASAYPTIHKKKHAQLLPKEAVLSNETLDAFWVMKVVHDSLAVKVPVTKGLETEQQVEILSPTFKPGARIIISGQYGLEDSSLVQIVKGGGAPQ